jgi:hypothetical protein
MLSRPRLSAYVSIPVPTSNARRLPKWLLTIVPCKSGGVRSYAQTAANL